MLRPQAARLEDTDNHQHANDDKDNNCRDFDQWEPVSRFTKATNEMSVSRR
ncbi:hypothetical protein ACNKHL_13305 [Shigella flexneri]